MADPYVYFDNYPGPIEVLGLSTHVADYAHKVIRTYTGHIVSGDGLMLPAPLILPISISNTTYTALQDNLNTVIIKARAAKTITYHDGINPIADRSVSGLLSWKVTRYEPLGYFMNINLVFAATSPYWVNRSTLNKEVWEW